MEIAGARPADAAALRRLVQRAYEPYVGIIGRRPAPMDDDYAVLIERARVLVARDADSLAGLIVLRDEPDHVLIENVAVDPAHQHKGTGRALLAAAEAHASSLGLDELRLYTNAAMTSNLALYPRLGFVQTARRRSAGFDRVYFSKRLDIA